MVLDITHRRQLHTSEGEAYGLQAAPLEAAMRADREAGLIPFFVCGTVGSTSSCAVDDIPGLGRVSQE
jgi:glutamate/tyrosine decarboxylase-like PLP-dependent enzyme